MAEEKDKGISEVIKKVVSIGVGAAFMTEDAVKKVLGDLPLPKEIVSGLLKNAQSVKDDFVQSVRAELAEHLSKVDPKKLLEEVLNNYDVDVQATVKFKKKK